MSTSRSWRKRAKDKAIADAMAQATDPVAASWVRGLMAGDSLLAGNVLKDHRLKVSHSHVLRDDEIGVDRGGLLYIAPLPPPPPVQRRMPGESLNEAKTRWAASSPYVDPGCAAMSRRPGRYVDLPKDI